MCKKKKLFLFLQNGLISIVHLPSNILIFARENAPKHTVLALASTFILTIGITLFAGHPGRVTAQSAPIMVGNSVSRLSSGFKSFLKFNIPVSFADTVSFDGDVKINGLSFSQGGGVSSLQGQTGDLVFITGSGITLNGLQLVNTDPGSSQNIFKSIVVGNESILATTNNDELGIKAGTGISLSSSGKTITISSTITIPTPIPTPLPTPQPTFDPSLSGWIDDGEVVSLTNDSDLVGIGTSNPDAKLHVIGDAIISETLTVNDSTVIAPTGDGDSLTVRAGTGNGTLFNATNNLGDTSYVSIASNGDLVVGDSTIANTGLFSSSGAIHLIDPSNTLIGTAIEGAWVHNGNTFNYRRTITTENTDDTEDLPIHYVVTVTLTGADAAHIFANTRPDQNDFRIAFNTTDIPRNITTFTSSNITFTYQLQAVIAAGASSDAYKIYYHNPELAQAASTYLEDVTLDTMDTTDTNWVSTDTAQYPTESDTLIKTEGVAALQTIATVDNVTAFSTTGQSPLDVGLSNFGFSVQTVLENTYLYTIGGSTDGTAANARASIYRTSVDAASGTVTAGTITANSLPSAVIDPGVVTYIPEIQSGTGEDGSLDLSLGAETGGCSGAGLSWSGSTCTILQSGVFSNGPSLGDIPASGAHAVQIPSGPQSGKILMIAGGATTGTHIYNPATNTYAAGPDLGGTASAGSHSFIIPTGPQAGKILTVVGNSTSVSRIYNPATNTYSAGPDLGGTASAGSHSFTIPSGTHTGKILTVRGNGTSTSIYDPTTHTYSAGPDIGTSPATNAHSFLITSGIHNGKFLTIVGINSSATRIYNPATNAYSAGPALTANASTYVHTFPITTGSNAGKFLTVHTGGSNATSLYDPATNTFSVGPVATGNPNAGVSFLIPSGTHAGKVLTLAQSGQTSLFDPATNLYTVGPTWGVTGGTGVHYFQIPSGSEAGKVLVATGSTSSTRIYDPTTHAFVNGPDVGAAAHTGSHSFAIQSGPQAGNILTVVSNSTSITKIFTSSTGVYSDGPDLGVSATVGSHSFVIATGTNAGKILTVIGGSSNTRIYDPATNAFSAGPALGTTATTLSHSFLIPSGSNAGKTLTFRGAFGTTRLYDPITNTYTAGPDLGASLAAGGHSFYIASGIHAGKFLTLVGNSTTTKLYDPATSTFSSGPDLGASLAAGGHSFYIASGVHAGKFLTLVGNSTTTKLYDPATNTFSNGPATTSSIVSGAASLIVPSGPEAGTVITFSGNSTATSKYDPATNTYSTGPSLSNAPSGTSGGFHTIEVSSGPLTGKFLIIIGSGKSTVDLYNPGKNTFNFTSVTIPAGTTLTPSQGFSNNSGPHVLSLYSTGNVSIGGTIDLNGKGYSGGATATAGFGPGAPSGSTGGGCGGSYGAVGGAGGNSTCTLGSMYSSEDSGSGGSGGANSSGGGGGGSISISSGGTLSISGTGAIQADGSAGTASGASRGGGGSGGLIKLLGTAVTNTGALSARGGTGGNGTVNGGGGGGGGRVQITYVSSVTPGTITTTGGVAGTPNGSSGAASAATSVSTNPIIYVLGGQNTSGNAQATVSQATINSIDGSVGSFSSSAHPLPEALYGHTATAVVSTNSTHFYVIGGKNGGTDQATVYKIPVDNVGVFGVPLTTGQTQLTSGISAHATVTGAISNTNYIWVIGGKNGSTAQNTIYRGTLDDDGNVTTLSTAGQAPLPTALYGHTAFFSTVGTHNYLYIIGGSTSDGSKQTAVYKATLDSTGDVTSVSTLGQTQLSTATSEHASFAFTDSGTTTHAYILGGMATETQSSIQEAIISSDQTTYGVSRTDFPATDLTNKGGLTFWINSERTGAYMSMEINTSAGWQPCDFSGSAHFTVNTPSTWEQKGCDISAITPRSAVTGIRFKVTSSSTDLWRANIDYIQTQTSLFSGTASTSNSSLATFGEANLTLNAQGSGMIRLNYDPLSSLAGTGGLTLYDGVGVSVFSVDGFGNGYISDTMSIGAANPGNHKFSIVGGTAYCDQTNCWLDASSRDLKTNISELTSQDLASVSAQIRDAKVYFYNRKEDPNGLKYLGVIAEEAPDWITSPDKKSISASAFANFLLAGLKSLQSDVDELRLLIEADQSNGLQSTENATGKAALLPGEDTVLVTSSFLTDDSQIFLTPEAPIIISAKKIDDVTFEIKASEVVEEAVTIQWRIVD